MSERRSQPSSPSASSTPRSLYSLAQIQHLAKTEFSRAARYKYPLCVLALCVDGLDSLRDAHGFEFKETVLREVVELLQRKTRSSDLIGRMADDHFVILLPHTPVGGAQILAARLIESAALLELSVGGQQPRISLSVGISTLVGELLFHDVLLELAEAALAEAVAQGGGRMVLREPFSR
jgi:diguanylate cyclase (GGDEF)-like protein